MSNDASTPASAPVAAPRDFQIKDFVFRPFPGKVAASGARTIGWIDMKFVLGSAEIEVHDLKCRVNAKGQHTLCAPNREYKLADGSKRTRSAYRFDDATYATLVDAIFQTSDVVAALGAVPVSRELVLGS